MLREEVLKGWEKCRKRSIALQKEIRELKPLALMAKNATWEVYATKVLLLEEEVSGSQLDNILSSWEGSASHYSGKSTGIKEHRRGGIGRQIIASWKVFPVKVLTMRFEELKTLEVRLMTNSFSKHLRKLLSDVPNPLPEPGNSKAKKIKWK